MAYRYNNKRRKLSLFRKRRSTSYRRTFKRSFTRRSRLFRRSRRYGGRKTYSKRGRYGSNYSFQKKVSIVSAQNSGLQFRQLFEGYNLENTTPGGMTFNFTECTAPGLLVAMGVLTNGDDSKVYLEKAHNSVRVFNNSNVPFACRRVWFRVKNNIPVSSYASMGALLQDGAPSINSIGGGDPLTSNAAQRYLKWTKMKRYIIQPGKMYIFNQKQNLRRFVTGDVEGNTGFLFTRGCIGTMFFYDGIPISDDGTPGDVSLGPVSVQITHSHKVTYRLCQDVGNSSTVSAAFPSLSGFGNVVEPVVNNAAPIIA